MDANLLVLVLDGASSKSYALVVGLLIVGIAACYDIDAAIAISHQSTTAISPRVSLVDSSTKPAVSSPSVVCAPSRLS